MLKKLLVVSCCFTATTVFASQLSDLPPSKKNQLKLLKRAQTYDKKTLVTPACRLYEQAYLMGYQGDTADMPKPKKNKDFIKIGLATANCNTNMELTEDLQKWLQGTIILFQLKNYFKVPNLEPKLAKFQGELLEVANELKFVNNAAYKKPTYDIQRACAAAEIGFKIGYLGDKDKAKDPASNHNYVQHGLYHAACVSLMPSKIKKDNPEYTSLLSYSILKELATNYDSAQARELSAPADALFMQAKAQLQAQVQESMHELAEQVLIPLEMEPPPMDE